MFFFNYPWLKNLLMIVAFGLAVAVSWSWYHKRERLHRGLMIAAALFGFWAYTDYWGFHDHGNHGRQNFHAHDFYHYYLGSKYIREWGYHGMYVTTVAALEEIGHEDKSKAITFHRIRDLRAGTKFINDRAEMVELGQQYRAKFSDARWAQLKADLGFLRWLAPGNDWWHGLLLDAGFNPPPTYAVLVSSMSNVLPLTKDTWTKLGALDFALIGIGAGAICWALGPVPGLLVFVVLGNSPVRTYTWTGGSFLRQVWLVCLMLGLAFLAKRKYRRGGAFLGLSSAAVLFPSFFLFGALVPLAFRAYRHRRPKYLIRAATGAAVALLALGSLSLVAYGPRPWQEWRQRISAHDVTFFTNHIGMKKLTTFVPEVAGHDFGAGDTLFAEWNNALAERGRRTRLPDTALGLLLTGVLVIGALRAKPAEAALMIGSGLLAIWTMPASYYTLYIGAYAAILVASRSTWYARVRFAVFAGGLYLSIVMHRQLHDLVLQSAALSAGWILTMLILAVLYWLEKPAFAVDARRSRQFVFGTAVGLACYVLIAYLARSKVYASDFLPPKVLQGRTVKDWVDVGQPSSEQAHEFHLDEDFRVDRRYLDVQGYRVDDGCGILRAAHTARYKLTKAEGPAHLIVRSDTFYGGGELLTRVNGKVLQTVRLDARRTMFAYLSIPLPADLPAGPVEIEHRVLRTDDIGLFTMWLVQ